MSIYGCINTLFDTIFMTLPERVISFRIFMESLHSDTLVREGEVLPRLTRKGLVQSQLSLSLRMTLSRVGWVGRRESTATVHVCQGSTGNEPGGVCVYVCTSCVCVYEQHVCMGVYVYPSVFNLEGAAAGVYVGSIESSFGLLGILNRFKRCDTIK